ncbi:unnamed protein product [Camellia sinensis]
MLKFNVLGHLGGPDGMQALGSSPSSRCRDCWAIRLWSPVCGTLWGYEYDEDHGEWFLYTGSGGRDLSGNKRMNKSQSFDQKFEKLNEALCVSCRKGIAKIPEVFFCLKESNAVAVRAMLYCLINCFLMAGPIRRNCPLMHQKQEYDMMGLKNVGTKLEFNDDHGDHPRPLPTIKELKNATDITERKGAASWDYDEEKVCWMWKKPAPHSRTQADSAYSGDGKRRCKIPSIQERLLKVNPQVNRELMGVIESLQHQNKKTEDNESSEETDCTCEKSDVVSGDAELCNVNSDILEEDDGKKGNQNSPSKSNHSKLTSERKLEVVIAYMKNPLRRLMQ